MSKQKSFPLSGNYNEVLAEERLVINTQGYIQWLLNDAQMTRADLAQKLGVSEARVSQIFGDDANLTLHTVARIFHALGEQCDITSPRLEHLKAAQRSMLESEIGGGQFEFSHNEPQLGLFYDKARFQSELRAVFAKMGPTGGSSFSQAAEIANENDEDEIFAFA